MFTRIVLFLLTNIAVLIVLSVTAKLFGIEPFLHAHTGISLFGLLLFSAAVGMLGALISCALSKPMAKRMMRVRLIDADATNDRERRLCNTVRRQAEMAGIGMPDVGIFASKQPNAFATGMFRNNALVAVSEGLLDKLTDDEVEAVLAHEVTHVANGDMVTLSLIQGVVNTFVIFFSRIIGILVAQILFRGQRGGYEIGYFICSLVAQIVLSVLATMIVMRFSRQREFRADQGGAKLAGRAKMIAALRRLQNATETEAELPKAIEAAGITGARNGGWRRLFMSHPPLEERIRALQEGGY